MLREHPSDGRRTRDRNALNLELGQRVPGSGIGAIDDVRHLKRLRHRWAGRHGQHDRAARSDVCRRVRRLFDHSADRCRAVLLTLFDVEASQACLSGVKRYAGNVGHLQQPFRRWRGTTWKVTLSDTAPRSFAGSRSFLDNRGAFGSLVDDRRRIATRACHTCKEGLIW